MYSKSVVGKVNEVLINQFELEEKLLTPEAHIKDDLELDSLDAVDMLVHLEDQLKKKVDLNKFQDVRYLKDIYEIVGQVVE